MINELRKNGINGEIIIMKIMDWKYTTCLKNIFIFEGGNFCFVEMCFLFLMMRGALMYF